jgi:DNA-directed RNA polymerase subunit H (RpoH/RPB5)
MNTQRDIQQSDIQPSDMQQRGIQRVPHKMMNTLLCLIFNRGYRLSEPYAEFEKNTWQDAEKLHEYWSTRNVLLEATRHDCPVHGRPNSEEKVEHENKQSVSNDYEHELDATDGCRLLVIRQPQGEEKLGKAHIQQIIQTHDEYLRKPCGRIILIYRTITPPAKTELLLERRIHIFHENELVRNIIEHVLITYHRKLSAAEQLAILKKFRLQSKTKLPSIADTDPIVRYYGFDRGDLIEVVRKYNGGLSQHVEYAVVARQT